MALTLSTMVVKTKVVLIKFGRLPIGRKPVKPAAMNPTTVAPKNWPRPEKSRFMRDSGPELYGLAPLVNAAIATAPIMSAPAHTDIAPPDSECLFVGFVKNNTTHVTTPSSAPAPANVNHKIMSEFISLCLISWFE